MTADVRDARRIFIVGASGFGHEVLAWARDAWAEATAKVLGFLAEERGECSSLPIVASPTSFALGPDDALLLAIGIPDDRRRVAESLLARGGRFLTLIHLTTIVVASASIGGGSILCPYSIVTDATTLGRFTILNYHASLGHDASTGDFGVLSPYATLGGGARVAADVFLGLHASVAPGKSVGASSNVSANSACLSEVPPGSLVFGVPGGVTRWLAAAAHGSDRPGGMPRP